MEKKAIHSLVAPPQSTEITTNPVFNNQTPNSKGDKLHVHKQDENSAQVVLPNGKVRLFKKRKVNPNNPKEVMIDDQPAKGFRNPFLGNQQQPQQQQPQQFASQKAQALIYNNKEELIMDKHAEKRNKDGVRTDDNFKGTRVENMHEDVCPETNPVCTPCNKKSKPKKEHAFVSTASKLSTDDLNIIKKPFNKIMSTAAKQDLIKSAAMADAVYMMPGKCQWCPKLRAPVSMHTCATVCPEGRRVAPKLGQTYTEYLVQGGSDDNSDVKCNIKMFIENEMDRYHPNWVNEHIEKIGGEVVGSETEFGGRRMNLDEGERRHLPRYPEEKLVERLLDERHKYEAPKTSFASASAKKAIAGKCDSCDSATVNGTFTHEHGCPKSHVGSSRECKWCGSKFSPASKGQQFCDPSCAESYNG